MQRGWIVRAPQADGRADQQREDADGGADDIERGIAAGYGCDLDVEHPLLAEAKHGVRQRIGSRGAGERALHLLDGLDRRAVDSNKHIARVDACRHRPAARGDVGGGDPFRTRFPEDAVLEFVRRGADGDVQGAKAQQHADQGK